MFAKVNLLMSAMIALAITTPASLQRPFTVLPGSEARQVTNLCSREGLGKIDGGWEPSDTTIQIAESQLGQLSNATDTGATVKSPAGYFRQYVGVIVSGRKLIYLNATAEEMTYWKTKFVDVCDGGSDFWGAIYDPATHKFSELHKNGNA